MEDVQLKLNEQGQGGFFAAIDGEQLGEMIISISGKELTVYHTEVDPKAEGKGLAKKMLTTMVEYVRKNGMKVKPLCPFVLAQFKRHPNEYADIWIKEEE